MTSLSREQAIKVAEIVHLLRPEWDRLNVFETLKQVARYDAFEVALAAVEAARDPRAVIHDIVVRTSDRVDAAKPQPVRVSKPPSRTERHPGAQAARDALNAVRGGRQSETSPETHRTAPLAASEGAPGTHTQPDPARPSDRVSEPPVAPPLSPGDEDDEGLPGLTPEDYDGNPSRPGSITRPQVNKIQILFRDLGVTARADRLEVIAANVGRPVGSTKDLTRNEAHIVIDVLTHLLDMKAPE